MARSFRSPFPISGSSAFQGHPTMSACRGGGSSATTSSCAARTCFVLQMAAPCMDTTLPSCSIPICRKLSTGSLPWRKTDFFPSFGFGRKAECLTVSPLNWLDDVRNRARSSSSSTCLGSPEGRISMIHDLVDRVENPARNNLPVKTGDSMTTVCPVEPCKGEAIGRSRTY